MLISEERNVVLNEEDQGLWNDEAGIVKQLSKHSSNGSGSKGISQH